jgi:hypothetical protein
MKCAETRKMLKETIQKMAGHLSDEDLKLTDYLRLGELADETGNRGVIPVRAGWVHGKVRA